MATPGHRLETTTKQASKRWRAGTGPSFVSADARPIKTLYFVSLIYARFKLRPFKLHYIRSELWSPSSTPVKLGILCFIGLLLFDLRTAPMLALAATLKGWLKGLHCTLGGCGQALQLTTPALNQPHATADPCPMDRLKWLH